MDENAVVDFCLAISAGEIRDVQVIADRLREFWQC